MLKPIAISIALTLSATAAQAAPLTCTTNIDHDPTQGATVVTVSRYLNGDVTSVSQITDGGMANFVTPAKKFTVTIKHIGPELVVYSNTEEGFELSVSFQPMGRTIRGNLITEALGQRINAPVVCFAAQN